jgi:hypothetical protein
MGSTTRHSSKAARWRRNRANGLAVAPVPYSGEIVDYLIRLHWLSEGLSYDRRAVGGAIARAVTRN